MNPAPSVIVFTVLSGLGFGYLGFLGVGFPPATGWVAFWLWGLGYALAVGGLLSSTLHLGHPERAWRAFSQWRSSWLSREGVAAVATLVILAPVALGAWTGLALPPVFGIVGALLCVATLISTAMIYAQMATVPRWNHWTTPATYLGFAAAGGAILAGERALAVMLCLALSGLLLVTFRLGDGRFAARGGVNGQRYGTGAVRRCVGFRAAPYRGQLPHAGNDVRGRAQACLAAAGHCRDLRRAVTRAGAAGTAGGGNCHRNRSAGPPCRGLCRALAVLCAGRACCRPVLRAARGRDGGP